MPIGSEGVVSSGLPQVVGEQAAFAPRISRRRETIANNLLQGWNGCNDEGSYWTAYSPTVGTGLAFGGAAITAFNDTTGAGLAIVNTDGVGARSVSLDYIKLMMTVVPTGTLAAPFMQFAGFLDNVQSRYSSGGTVLSQVSPNGGYSAAFAAKCYAGALTLNAITTYGRRVCRGTVRNVAPVVNDMYLLVFGSIEKAAAAQSLALATAGVFVIPCPPVEIQPNGVFTLHHWCGGQTAAPSYELEVCGFDR